MARVTYIPTSQGNLHLAQEIINLPKRYKFAVAETPFDTILVSDTELKLNDDDIQIIIAGFNECNAHIQYRTVILTDSTEVMVSI